MSKNKQKPVTVGFVALGCPKNIVDSEKMLAIIGEAGFMISGDPDNADVVVINTCGFIEPAKAEAIDAIKRALKLKKKGKIRKVVVTGCLSQRLGDSLLEEVKGIDAVVGLGARDSIADVIKSSLAQDNAQVYIPENTSVHDDSGRLLITPNHWAYLKISDGCNRKCSFCTIPAIRGKFRSKPQDMILAEARELAANGALELSIIAQDSNFYGRDFKIENGLSLLLQQLENIDDLAWIRLMYLYPAGVDQKLIDTIAQSKKVLHYFDMPMQHINNDILKRMHRIDTREKTATLIEHIRKALADAVLRTTIITGFPGETDEQFHELLEFIKWAQFDALGCFTFCAEPGTAAAELPDQIPQEVRQQRADELMLAQQEIVFAKNRSRIGTVLTCLVDSVDENDCGEARFYGQAPHIDSICIVNNCSAVAGEFIQAKVIDTNGYDFIVDQI